MTWVLAFGLAAAMAAVGVGTSYFWLRLARVPSYVAGVSAPAVTMFLVLAAGWLFRDLGIFWSGARAIPLLLAFGLVGAALYLWRQSRRLVGDVRPGTLWSTLLAAPGRWPIWFWSAVVAGFLLAVLPWVFIAPASNPVQQWDPTFHQNAVWEITHYGSGKWGDVLGPDFAGGRQSDYPLGWHIFVSLFATPATTVVAANASSLALILLWVAGAGAYTRLLFAQARSSWVRIAGVVAPLLAGGMLSMPADALMAYNQWPAASSTALLPGLAALAIVTGRALVTRLGAHAPQTGEEGAVAAAPVDEEHAVAEKVLGTIGEEAEPVAESSKTHGESPASVPSTWAHIAALAGITLAALIGVAAVHPVVTFGLFFLLFPALVAGCWHLSLTDWLRGGPRRWRAALWPAVCALAVAVVLVVLDSAALRGMGQYPRSGVSWAVAFANALTPTPPYPSSLSLFLWTAAIVLLLFSGVFALYLARDYLVRWPLFSFLSFAALTVLTYSPDSALRTFLTAPWYLDPRRVMQPENLAMLPLMAIGFAWVASHVHEWVTARAADGILQRRSLAAVAAALAGALVIVSGGEGFLVRQSAARSVFDPDNLGKPGMATAGELAMLQELGDLLPADAVVLGDPQAGAAYVQMIGQRRAYFPMLTLGYGRNDNEETLINDFRDIHTDPRVCQAVREEGITHFYAEQDGQYYSRMRSDRMPGLYGVDTAEGFELVASGDTASVYEITACQ